jgi:hypothetical protein
MKARERVDVLLVAGRAATGGDRAGWADGRDTSRNRDAADPLSPTSHLASIASDAGARIQ